VFATIFGAVMLYRIGRHYVDVREELRATKAKLAAAKQARKKKFWSGELRVARIFQETPDVKTFRMVDPGGGPLPFEHVAGQYLNLALSIAGKRVNRSYTIASSPTRNQYCEITVKRDGLASQHLHGLTEGATLKVSAPAGKFVFAGTEAKRIILIAGGVGITPMMAVVRSLTDRCWDGEIYLVYSVRKRDDVIFERELEALQQRFPNLHVKLAYTSETGRITKEQIRELVPNVAGPIMVCGPEPMMAATRAMLIELGVPDDHIHEEAFVSPPATTEDAPASEAATAIELGEPGTIQFARARKSAEAMGLTVLEAAEECDIAIPSECRSGICGQCKTKLVSGRVVMEVQDALTAGDRQQGLILACQARAVADVVVDA
jgi:ferredoxin-NADP reductase